MVKKCITDGCTTGARNGSATCMKHLNNIVVKRCRTVGCTTSVRTELATCAKHSMKTKTTVFKRCSIDGCTKYARSGVLSTCSRHKGGFRCSFDGCSRGAQGPKKNCKKHGGCFRCVIVGCSNSAARPSNTCISHGPRCSISGCKSGPYHGTTVCIAHGSGRRCTFVGCLVGAQSGSSMCKRHNGPIMCSVTDCLLVARDKGLCPRHLGRVCTVSGCTTPYRDGGDGSMKCRLHKGGPICSVEGCYMTAARPCGRCVRHANRCSITDCNTGTRYGSDKCTNHGGSTTVNDRCKNDDVHRYEEFNPTVYYADRSKGVCFGCYESLYPEKLKRFARREHLMLAEITRLAPELMDCNHVTHDCPMVGGCSLHRPDMLFDFGTSWFSIEVDENGHDQAIGKYDMITKAMNNVPGILLRINTCGRKPMFKKRIFPGYGSRYDGSVHFESKMCIIMDCVKNEVIPVLTKDDFGPEFKEIKLFFD